MTTLTFPVSSDLADWRHAFYDRMQKSYFKVYAPDAEEAVRMALRSSVEPCAIVYLGFSGVGHNQLKCVHCGVCYFPSAGSQSSECPNCGARNAHSDGGYSLTEMKAND